jgi:hypothetical protein
MDENLEQIKELIENIENSEKTPELIDWMKEISTPDYGLVDSMIDTFMERMSDIKLANSILKALRYPNLLLLIDLTLASFLYMPRTSSFPK